LPSSYYASETKYSITISADDSITKKFPVLKDGPLKVALFWHTQFDELTQLKNFDVYKRSTPQWLEMPRTSGSTPTMMLCPTMKISPKLTSVQCGLPSLSTMEHPTKLPKDYKTFYERPRSQPI
jgi:hypothetical protein